jgi:hypothetical protein
MIRDTARTPPAPDAARLTRMERRATLSELMSMD